MKLADPTDQVWPQHVPLPVAVAAGLADDIDRWLGRGTIVRSRRVGVT